MTNLFDLTGKVAIVTGGNGGIGFGMAQGLAGAGANVVVAARNPEKNTNAVAKLQSLGVQSMAIEVDVTIEAAVNAMVQTVLDKFGRVDILCNNAGTNIRKAPQLYSLEEWRYITDTNLTSAFLCSKAVYQPMVTGGGGKIISTGSMTTLFGAPFGGPYSATKGGIVQFTKALATAWAKDNIQANAILPGWIDTDLTKQARKDIPWLQDRVEVRTPMGRWGRPDDHAGVAVFLASAASNFVTGAAIPVDGGYSAMV